MCESTFNCADKLTYGNQLEFKKWAKRHGLTKKAGADYYFDSIYAVDARKSSQPTIRGVVADGSLTFREAAAKLKKHFKT